ncbi:MAG: hypothetical protein ACT6FG_00360 [Methanosarcinaceae archaeon]
MAVTIINTVCWDRDDRCIHNGLQAVCRECQVMSGDPAKKNLFESGKSRRQRNGNGQDTGI